MGVGVLVAGAPGGTVQLCSGAPVRGECGWQGTGRRGGPWLEDRRTPQRPHAELSSWPAALSPPVAGAQGEQAVVDHSEGVA